MKKVDLKHIAYHTLCALFFIWVTVFGILLCATLLNTFGAADNVLTNIFMPWIFMNLIMGTALLLVLLQFRKRNRMSNTIRYIYYFMGLSAIITAALASYYT